MKKSRTCTAIPNKYKTVMVDIKRLHESDRPALRQFWKQNWGDDFMVAHGQIYTIEQLDGFVAVENKTWLGLITFIMTGKDCEIMSLDSLREGTGIGTALMKEVEKEALSLGCSRLVLVTTNDNTHALRFYQKHGFELAALRPRAIEVSRKIKPSIPLTGHNGIPIRDELELELRLDAAPSG
jgi:ribosomal protein S18 acetylase RimI-like enzyme